MKLILKIVIVALCAWLMIWLDTLLYDVIVSAIPPTDWMKLIKIGIIVLMVIYTGGLVITLTAFASVISMLILDVILPKRKRKFQQKLNKEVNEAVGRKLDNLPTKSKFQQKLEQMAEERKRKLN